MKVLFSTNIPAPYRVAFFNELGRLCDLTVLYERKYANDRNRGWLEEKTLNYQSHYLPGLKIGADGGFNPGVMKWLSRKKFDIIVIGDYSTPTGMLSILWLRFRHIPYFVSADGGMIGNDSLLKFKLKKFFISHASIWLSSGEETDRYLTHYGAEASRIKRFPMTSVSEEYIDDKPAEIQEKRMLRQQLGISEEKIVLSVGSTIYRKGFDILIKAASKLEDDFGIYIIGGEPTNEYLSLMNQYSVRNVHFISFMAPDEIKLFFRASDLFVLPTRYDVWGLVVNEAMASGLPVITTDKCVAGLELVEDNKNGFIIPVESYDELARKINSVMKDNRLREEMARESLRKIQGYSIENMAKTHFEIFNESLNKGAYGP